MKTAIGTRGRLSEEETLQRMARDRADAVKFYKMNLEMAREAGIKEGEKIAKENRRKEEIKKGMAEVIFNLLDQRFGPLSEDIQTRVQSAPLSKLDLWQSRMFTAETLDELLAD